MESVLLALQALQLLIQNPRLGGGGIKKTDTVTLIGHLIELIVGGQATAAALKEFAEEIHRMAVTGVNPTTRDFDVMTARLDAALSTLADAEARLDEQDRIEDSDAPIGNGIENAPVETPDLKATDEASVGGPK